MTKEVNILEQICKIGTDKEVRVSWRWRDDKQRSYYMRATKKKYFIKLRSTGSDLFKRTDKKFIEGDSLKKSIDFSNTQPQPHDLRCE